MAFDWLRRYFNSHTKEYHYRVEKIIFSLGLAASVCTFLYASSQVASSAYKGLTAIERADSIVERLPPEQRTIVNRKLEIKNANEARTQLALVQESQNLIEEAKKRIDEGDLEGAEDLIITAKGKVKRISVKIFDKTFLDKLEADLMALRVEIYNIRKQ